MPHTVYSIILAMVFGSVVVIWLKQSQSGVLPGTAVLSPSRIPRGGLQQWYLLPCGEGSVGNRKKKQKSGAKSSRDGRALKNPWGIHSCSSLSLWQFFSQGWANNLVFCLSWLEWDFITCIWKSPNQCQCILHWYLYISYSAGLHFAKSLACV